MAYINFLKIFFFFIFVVVSLASTIYSYLAYKNSENYEIDTNKRVKLIYFSNFSS